MSEHLDLKPSEVETLLDYKEPETTSLSQKYNSERVTLTSPEWMLDAIKHLAAGNLMKRNKLINCILFDYIKRNIHLFAPLRQETLAEVIKDYEQQATTP